MYIIRYKNNISVQVKRQLKLNKQINEYIHTLITETWPIILVILFVYSADNTARILTRRGSFNRHEMSLYLLPVVISDNDYPIQSSTSTLTVRVCACDSRGNVQSCSTEALLLSAGLSTGALVAILLCIIILLSKWSLL